MSENGPMPSLRSRLFMRAAYCLYINICIGSFCYFGTISVRRHPDRISCAMSSRALITKKRSVKNRAPMRWCSEDAACGCAPKITIEMRDYCMQTLRAPRGSYIFNVVNINFCKSATRRQPKCKTVDAGQATKLPTASSRRGFGWQTPAKQFIHSLLVEKHYIRNFFKKKTLTWFAFKIVFIF